MTTSPEAGYPGELRVYGDPERLASAAAELFVSAAAEAITAALADHGPVGQG